MSLSWSWETSCRHTALTGFPFFTTLGGVNSPLSCNVKGYFHPLQTILKGIQIFGWLVAVWAMFCKALSTSDYLSVKNWQSSSPARHIFKEYFHSLTTNFKG